jgi:hypothetical protein
MMESRRAGSLGDPGPSAAARRSAARWWPAFAAVAVVATGMAYSFWWPSVVRHTRHVWAMPGDLWSSAWAAHWVVWGVFSYIYSAHVSIVTLPGFEVLLAPVVALGSALGLGAPVPHLIWFAEPREWLLLGPLAMATSAVALYGLDSVARVVGIGTGRRAVLTILEAAALWPTIVIWGHPEDVLALGLCAFALARAFQGKFVWSAWLLGGALVMQLYVVAAVPVFLGIVGLRRAPSFLARCAVIPGAVFLAVLIPDPHATLHYLLDQPNYPTVDFPTPWVLVAPSVAAKVVAAGPARLVGLAAACGIGAVAARRRHDPLTLVWLTGLALCTRCLFEPVLDPYYVAPPLAFALLALADRGRIRWALTAGVAAGLVVLTYYRTGMWWYWTEMAAAFGLLFTGARPAATRALPALFSVGPTLTGRRSSAEDLHPKPDRVPFGVLRYAGDGPCEDATGRPEASGRVQKL